jgi:hypothetical protein
MDFLEKLICGQCGQERVYIVSGCVCPEGHGRLYPFTRVRFRLAREQLANYREVQALPTAERLKKGIYMVDGHGYRWAGKQDHCLQARYRNRRIWLEPLAEPAETEHGNGVEQAEAQQ